MSEIPKNRLILYIMLIGLLPLIVVGLLFWSKKGELDQLENQIQFVQQLALTKQRKQSINLAAHDQFKNADHFYLDKNLETLTFLQPEIESLRTLMENKNFAGDENLTKRLEKLQGKENKILFSGGQVLAYPTFQESILSLTNPVEVNTQDLGEILAKTEGIEIGDHKPGPKRPQLIVIDFKIESKDTSNKNEAYLLNMKLLKREYL